MRNIDEPVSKHADAAASTHASIEPASTPLRCPLNARSARGASDGPRGIPHRRAPSRLRAVGYLRRSTDRQEQSIGDQRAAVERFAAEHGYEILRHYTDDGISGASTAGRKAFQRLIGDARSETRDFDVVICYDVKRFGRIDNDEAGYYRHILRTRGVEVLYASEGFTGGVADDLLRPVKQWQARQESKDLSKVVIRGLLSKATLGQEQRIGHDPIAGSSATLDEATEIVGGKLPGDVPGDVPGGRGVGGWWMGGAPPYGYDLRYESASGAFIVVVRYARDGSKSLLDERGVLVRVLPRGETITVSKRDRCRLIPGEPERVEAVRSIFRMYVDERKGFKQVAAALNRTGAPTARSTAWSGHASGLWSLTSVRAILMNPAYCGDMVWNRRTDARFHRIIAGRAVERVGTTGRRLEDNDPADWIIAREAHEAIIPRRTWERAREIREEVARNQQRTRPRAARPAAPRSTWHGPRKRFLLSGLLRCARCGCAYEGRKDRPGRANRQGDRSVSFCYICGGYLRCGKGTCERGAVRQMELEARIIDALLGFYAVFTGKGSRDALHTALRDRFGGESAALERERASVRARLEEIAAMVRSLLDNLTRANRAFVDERLEELALERGELEAALEALEQRGVSASDTERIASGLCVFFAGLESTLRDGDPHAQRAALERCIEGVLIDARSGVATLRLRRLPIEGAACENGRHPPTIPPTTPPTTPPTAPPTSHDSASAEPTAEASASNASTAGVEELRITIATVASRREAKRA